MFSDTFLIRCGTFSVYSATAHKGCGGACTCFSAHILKPSSLNLQSKRTVLGRFSNGDVKGALVWAHCPLEVAIHLATTLLSPDSCHSPAVAVVCSKPRGAVLPAKIKSFQLEIQQQCPSLSVVYCRLLQHYNWRYIAAVMGLDIMVVVHC